MILALTTMPEPKVNDALAIEASSAERAQQVDELQEKNADLQLEKSVVDEQAEVAQQVLQNVVAATEAPTVAVDVNVAPLQVDVPDFSERTAPKSDLLGAGWRPSPGPGWSRRRRKAKMVAMVAELRKRKAVAQRQVVRRASNHDGSWSFDHRTGPCQGRCSDAGTLSDCRTGATAMALLPFLGAGQTHQQGEYKQVVERGLYYLTNAMRVRHEGGMQTGNLAQTGGNMYAHGLAAITLCEAYAMTHDRKLMNPAQLSLNHIMFAQDPIGGGWRYVPRQPGDTSVVGWQLMALKSGHMAYLAVDPKTIQLATKFLDRTSADEGGIFTPAPRTGHDGRWLALPHVSGLEARQPGTQARRAIHQHAWPFAGQHVLQLLRHAGAAAILRRPRHRRPRDVGQVEHQRPRLARQGPRQNRPPKGKLAHTMV
jgi:hypothetical protein